MFPIPSVHYVAHSNRRVTISTGRVKHRVMFFGSHSSLKPALCWPDFEIPICRDSGSHKADLEHMSTRLSGTLLGLVRFTFLLFLYGRVPNPHG